MNGSGAPTRRRTALRLANRFWLAFLWIALRADAGQYEIASCDGTGVGTATPGGCTTCFAACAPPIVLSDPVYSLDNGGCDPSVTSCGFHASVSVEFPGNRLNNNCPFFSPARDSKLGNDVCPDACPGSDDFDFVTEIVSGSAFCGTSAPLTLELRMCVSDVPGCAGCGRITTVPVDPSGYFCPAEPPTWSCGEGDTAAAAACCIGPGLGAPPTGGGGARDLGSFAFGGSGGVFIEAGHAYRPDLGAPPGMTLSYLYGGAGGFRLPENSAWGGRLGRFWSHSFSERVVPSPGEEVVWLITGAGSFRKFSNPDGSGLYEDRLPADEYRQLRWLGAGNGWSLTSLDGTITYFRADGLWDRTEDRNGHGPQAFYDANVRIERVEVADGTKIEFTYHANGLLQRLRQVGVGGSPTRDWTYTWAANAGRDLRRIDRPDGTSWRFSYDNTFPPHMSMAQLFSAPGTTNRVEGAWEYDAQGRLARAWRGSSSFAAGVDKLTWSYVSESETNVTDSYGNVTQYLFDRDTESGKPRVTSVSSPCPACGLAASSTIAYDNPSNPGHPLRPWKITDGEGIITELRYDGFGMVSERTEALGHPLERTTFFEYDPDFPAFVTLTDRESVVGGCPTPRQTVRSYADSSGNLESETRLGCAVVAGAPQSLSGDVTLFGYVGTTAGSPTSIDPPGFGAAEDLTSFDFDGTRGDQVLLSRTDPQVGTTFFGTDSYNRRTTVTDVNGVVTTTVYDDLDRVTSVTREGALDAEDERTRYFYSDLGDLFCVAHPRGNGIQYGYDSAGRRTSVARGTAFANPSSTQCLDMALRRERTFSTYNAGGQITRQEQQFCSSGPCSGGWTTEARTDYDFTSSCHADRVKRAKTLSPAVTFATTELAYDCNGNLVSVWDANHPVSGTPSTMYTFDALNRLKETRQPWGPTAANCSPTEAGDPDCSITSYDYDSQHHLVSVVDSEGNATSYVFDDRDVLTSQSSAASGLTRYEYNLHRELTKETDARSVVTNRTMDGADRVELVDYPGTALDVDYVYGAAADPVDFTKGRLKQIVRDPAGAAPMGVTYKYDRFGRRKQDGEISRTFDKNGNALTETHSTGLVASFSYDFADREATLSVNPGTGPVNLVSTSSYKANGPLSSMTFGSSPARTETRGFDARYLPSSIDVSGSLLHWDYVNDDVGNVSSISQTSPSPSSRAYGYQDFQYFLTCAAGPWASGSGCNPVSGQPLRWTYDKIGNRLTEMRGGATDVYTYGLNGAGGRTPLLDTVTVAGGNRDYTFGAAGHLELLDAGANVVDFVIDAPGQVAGFSRAVDRSASFLYDGRGYLSEIRTLQPASGGGGGGGGGGANVFSNGFEAGTPCLWSIVIGWGGGSCPTGPIETNEHVTYDASGRLRFRSSEAFDPVYYYYFAGRPVATYTAGPQAAFRFLTTDHLGTPIHTLDTDGTTSWLGGFEPFGRDFTGNAMTSGLRLPGQFFDSIWTDAALGTEVGYNVHRWIETGTGRYSRPDPAPVSLTMGSPLFGYADARPTVLSDPLGLWNVGPTCKDTACQNQYPCNIAMDPKGVLAGIEDSCRKVSDEGSPCGQALAEVGGAEGIPDLPGCVKRNTCSTDSGAVLDCSPCQWRCGIAVAGNVSLGGPGNPDCGQSPEQGQGYGPTLLHEAMHLCGMRGDVPAGNASPNARRLEAQWRRVEWACFNWNLPGAAH